MGEGFGGVGELFAGVVGSGVVGDGDAADATGAGDGVVEFEEAVADVAPLTTQLRIGKRAGEGVGADVDAVEAAGEVGVFLGHERVVLPCLLNQSAAPVAQRDAASANNACQHAGPHTGADAAFDPVLDCGLIALFLQAVGVHGEARAGEQGGGDVVAL